ncbi:MAG: caspase family protein [Cytophagales bacterium]|nr:caspase family protein [Cytophagales bacterium]MDW8383138.1 WD40 repeat domain-containing protein [Flammeovirgaceae bacterium]
MKKILFVILFGNRLLFGQAVSFEFSANGNTYQYNAKGMETLSNPLLTLTVWGNDWFLYDANGRFDGTENGLKNALLVSGTTKTPCSKQLPTYTKSLAYWTLDAYSIDILAEQVAKRVTPKVAAQVVFRPSVVVEPQKHTDEIMSILFSQSLNVIITLSKDKTIRLWDVETGENIRTIRTYSTSTEEGQFFRAVLSPDGKRIYAGGFMDKNKGAFVGSIKVYDLTNGELLGVLDGSPQSINTIACSQEFLASGNNDKSLYIWNQAYIQKVFSQKQNRFVKAPDKVFESDVSGVSFSPDGKYLVVSRYASKSVYWAELVSDGETVKFVNEKQLDPGKHNKALVSVATSPDGKYVLSSDPNHTHLWDIQGNHIRLFAEANMSVEGAIRFSPSGKAVLLGNAVYSFPEGEKIGSYSGPGKTNNFLDDETIVFRNSDNELVLWNTKEGKLIKKIGKVAPTQGVAFLGDGLKIALSSFFPRDMQGQPTEYPADKHLAVFDFEKLQLITENLPVTALPNYLKHKHNGVQLARYINNQILDLDILKVGENFINTKRNYGTVSTFTFTPNGNILVGFTLNLVLFDASGNELRRFKGHSSGIKSLAISPNGNYAVSLGDDQTICLWNLNETGQKINNQNIVKPLASLFVQDNEWICFDTKFRYASSKRGGRLFGFVENMSRTENPQFYTMEQFDLLLNRPDLVAKSLKVADEKFMNQLYNAYQRRLKKYNLKETDLRLEPNPIKIVINSPSGKVDNPNINLSFTAQSAVPLQRYDVYINDVRIKRTDLTNLSLNINESFTTTLSHGRNKIQIVAFDQNGNQSPYETVRLYYQAKETKLPVLYYVSIAVSQYKDASYDLTYPTKDATDLLKQWQGATGKVFSEVKFLQLHNQEATAISLQKAKTFLSQSNVNDYAVIFVAGHGLIAGQNWYFATSTTDFSNPQNGGILYEQLEGLFEQIPARNRLMLLDACHSGELDSESITVAASEKNAEKTSVKSRGFKTKMVVQEISSTSFYLLNDLFPDLNKGTGAAIISAAGGAEFAFESDVWKNGVFTYSFIEGIKSAKADLNQDKKITVGELRKYVAQRVSFLTEGKQNPTSRAENLENDFRIW